MRVSIPETAAMLAFWPLTACLFKHFGHEPNLASILGFGVAIGVRCAALEPLRNEARSAMEGELSQQDLQPWKPHVTVQNNVSAETGRQLYRILEANFTERAAERIAFGKVV